LIETFFLNVLYSGNISTMLPRQDLFGGKLSLIRILAYLEKNDVITIGDSLGLGPVENLCPLADDTRRDSIRSLLDRVYREIPDAKGSVFSALGNIREGYML
jgi:tRNA 2-thiocytidine biosynthesis protein TtcA